MSRPLGGSWAPDNSDVSYQGHVVNPPTMVLLKVMYSGNVIKNTNCISNLILLHLNQCQIISHKVPSQQSSILLPSPQYLG